MISGPIDFKSETVYKSKGYGDISSEVRTRSSASGSSCGAGTSLVATDE
jgi:hypothetical protein